MKDNNIDLFFETSAKTAFNIQKVFTEISKTVFDKFIKNKSFD